MNELVNAPKLSSPRVRLYTRRGCDLCEIAQQTLEAHGLTPTCIDIDGNSDLRERFNECVPVVEIDDKIRFRGHVDPVLLRRLLTAFHR